MPFSLKNDKPVHQSAEPQNTEEEWVPLENVPGAIYAEMVAEVLDQNDIPCYIHSDPVSATLGVTGGSAVGGTSRLFVPETQMDAAKLILHQMLDHI
ncbi:DUF2007 domain-containing protein [bacterium]|nr:DUF2007 domain-containing protein [bacterium]